MAPVAARLRFNAARSFCFVALQRSSRAREATAIFREDLLLRIGRRGVGAFDVGRERSQLASRSRRCSARSSPFPSRNGESFFSNVLDRALRLRRRFVLVQRFELLVHGVDLAIRLPRLRKLAFDIAIERKRLLKLRARRVDARIGRDRQRLMRFLAIDDQHNVVIARQRQRTFRRQRRVLAPHGRDRIVVFDRLRPRPAQVPDEAVRAGFG